jgi:hypothetical protein
VRSAGTPVVSFAPFLLPRCGRRSVPLTTYLRLMVGYLIGLAVMATTITLIATTGRRLNAAGGVLPAILLISAGLANLAGAAGKVLVNARRALPRAIAYLTHSTVTSTATAFPQSWRTGAVPTPTRTQRHRSATTGSNATGEPPRTGRTPNPGANWQKIAGPDENGNPRSTTRRDPQIAGRGPQPPTADFFRSK